MKTLILLVSALFSFCHLFAQEAAVSKTRFIIGLSGPELLHAGLTHRLANASLLGISSGVAPSWGTVWTSVNLEHRLYIGRASERSNQKTFFFRQGTTFFPAESKAQQFTINLTAGKDFPFKNTKNGFTFDAGVFYLPKSEDSSIILVRSLNLWPALRFEFYFSL